MDFAKQEIEKYISLIRENLYVNYKGMFREPGGHVKYKFISPGSNQYSAQLWDWDSWLSDIALRQILVECGSEEDIEIALEHEKGCILSFLEYAQWNGWLPICLNNDAKGAFEYPDDIFKDNMHKPVLNQHAAFVVKQMNGDAEWLREKYYYLQTFCNKYKSHHRDPLTGIYRWVNDNAVGVDDDPCSWGRPDGSCGSIYLNCFMYKELKACAYIGRQLGQVEVAASWEKDAEELKHAINEHCWDERDGFYYSVDLNLSPVKIGADHCIHQGYLRDYHCLIQRIGVWSGFLGIWAGLASKEQAERVVREHYCNPKTFHAPFGVRTLSKMEKMYNVRASGNPSTWRGPVWGASNYLTFSGLVHYGFEKEARELAEKSIIMFGRDIERFGAMHEYYEPETGEPILNRGFQNWNYLVLNMINWYEGKEAIKEF